MTPGFSSVLRTAAATVSSEEVQAWGEQFNRLHERIAPHLKRVDTRQHAQASLQRLLSSIERKTDWQIADQVGEATPYAIQHLVGRSVWDADAVCNETRRYVVEPLGQPEGMLVIDETGFIKKGNLSVGMQRQYSCTAGWIENCQIGGVLKLCDTAGLHLLTSSTLLT
ncbi:MAG: transposase [Stenomitos rutilans HA7619-LM2]|jgi:SRSO17 transposase|nr:transposase [Stenomitos rutilans HA7619-LM2]